MPTPTIPYLIEVALHASQGGQQRVNVLHCIGENVSPTNDDVINAANAMKDAVEANLVAWTDEVTFNYVTAKSLRGTSSVESTVAFGTGTTGANSTGSAPSPIALVITLRSSFIGRRNRGRVFTFGTVKDNTTADIFEPGYVGLVLDWLEEWTANLNVSSLFPVIASLRYRGWVLVQELTTDAVVRVQRRREVNVGS